LVATLVGCSAAPPTTRRDGGTSDAGWPDAGPRPDGGIDAGTDAGPCAPLARCGGECVDTAIDSRHCGACDDACSPPSNAAARCAGGSCDFGCFAGFVRDADACVPAPRPLWPPSLSTTRTLRPTLRWAMPSGLGDATVELCEDPACATIIATTTVAGESIVPELDLPAGPIFWRVSASGRTGPTWRFDVARRAAPIESAWGIAPDYDGDGYGDVAIGAPFAADSAGRVALHLGAPGGTLSAATSILRGPDGAGAEYGVAVACAGDLDGDGFAELAVGSPGAERVWIYFGGVDGIPESGGRRIALEAPAGGSRFGGALAGAGDVDGDGYGDLVVAATGEGTDPGRIHVYHGRAGGVTSTPARTVIGGGRFGSAVAGALDLDADGFAEIVVGAYAALAMNGEAHVFRGGPGGIGDAASITIAGTRAAARLGFSVAGAGDVNGDGYADLVLGAPDAGDGAGSMGRGEVLVFHGSASGVSATADLVIAGVSSGGAYFGHSVAGLGDGNGDGYDELAVSAFGANARAGRVSVFLGGAGGLVTITRTTVDGPYGAGGDFGWSIASAGDVDGNGRHDLVVGAPGVDDLRGRAYIFRGNAAGIGATPLVDLLGASAGGRFGRAVASAGR
jgi:hypothetical protein